jgi:prolipoprotein diacylglyceryltransferase
MLPFFFARKNRGFYFDLYALYLLLVLSLTKFFVCWGIGCCFGVPSAWGIYNETLATTVFPVQFLEFAVGTLLAVGCILYMLYAKSYRPGRASALCILSFVVPRFFWDFLRYRGADYRHAEQNGVLGITMIQTACIAGTALLLVWLFMLPWLMKGMNRLWAFVENRLRGPS